MDASRMLRLIVLIGALLACGSLALFFKNKTTSLPLDSLVAATTYLGPKSPIVGNPQLVRVEVLVKDAPEANGLQVTKVTFNGENVPLKPRDIYGQRGGASFQVPPGTYKLKWTVNKDRFAWPRTVSHEEEVTVSPRDLWLQLSIEGETASIR